MLKHIDKVNRIIIQIEDDANEIESNYFYINKFGAELISESLINNNTLKYLNLNPVYIQIIHYKVVMIFLMKVY
jgi:hypothetical protein